MLPKIDLLQTFHLCKIWYINEKSGGKSSVLSFNCDYTLFEKV